MLSRFPGQWLLLWQFHHAPERAAELGGQAVHKDNIVDLVAQAGGLALAAHDAEAGTRIRSNSALVVSIGVEQHIVQAQHGKGVVQDQDRRLGPVALAPAVLLADQNAVLSVAVRPVDASQPGAPDAAQAGPLVNCKLNGPRVLLLASARETFLHLCPAEGTQWIARHDRYREVVLPARKVRDHAFLYGTQGNFVTNDIENRFLALKICLCLFHVSLPAKKMCSVQALYHSAAGSGNASSLIVGPLLGRVQKMIQAHPETFGWPVKN